MRVAVVGGLGFLGSRIAVHLRGEDHEVVLATRRKPSPASWIAGAEVRRIDWNYPSSLESVCQGADAVIHVAGLDAQGCAHDPSLALSVNGHNVQQMVDAAVRAGVGRFVHFSTAHVYRSPLEGRITEDTPVTNTHPYASSHAEGERFVRSRSDDIDGVSVRLSNAFGVPAYPAVHCWRLVVNDLCRQVVERGRLTVHNGTACRDFIALSQVTNAVSNLLTMKDLAALGGILNVGSGTSATVEGMARLIQGRAQAVLGVCPPVEGLLGETAGPSLDYASARPFPRAPNPELVWRDEVDALLRYCGGHFRRSGAQR